MIAIIAAESSPWLATLTAAARAIAPTEVWAPPGWSGATRVARALAGAAVDRRYRTQFGTRWLLDHWARREVMRRRPALVIAPSLAARGTLAAARELGIATAVLVDIPVLRVLHADLDRAAGDDPASRFLRRFRAAPHWVARQEAELVLADLVLARGHYAARAMRERGARRVSIVTPPPPRAIEAGGRAILLAGGATARAGAAIAADAAARLGRRLLARRCEGTESALLGHPAIDWLSGPPPPIAAVVAPARCEAYPPELAAAARAGIPIVATEAAWHPHVALADLDAALAAALAAPTQSLSTIDRDALPRTLAQALAASRAPSAGA